jgi:Domain of Unknown Function (DUF1259)
MHNSRWISRPISLRIAACMGAAVLTAICGRAAVAQQKAAVRQSSTTENWAGVEQTLGRKGAMNPGGVMKFGFPRSDLQVMIGDVQLKPALALGGWVAFKPLAGGRAMALGDLVLTADEAGPVMQRLQEGGISQTALHNHLLGENPRLMYMHVMAEGDPAKLAETLRAALGESKTPMTVAPPAAPSATIDLDTTAVARALGYTGKVNGGVYQVSVPRAERIVDMGQEIPPSMGVATGINFQPTGGGKAAITGDFVLIGSEVNPVIRTLRENGIQVTAVHSHMLQESPRLFFMHFWANDDATKLATALHAALAHTNSKRR